MPRQTEPPRGHAARRGGAGAHLDLVEEMPAELRPIREATGQVLAEDVVAPFDIPPRDNTAMDGYAVRAGDTAPAGADVAGDGSAELRVIGELAAGYLYEGVWAPARPCAS